MYLLLSIYMRTARVPHIITIYGKISLSLSLSLAAAVPPISVTHTLYIDFSPSLYFNFTLIHSLTLTL